MTKFLRLRQVIEVTGLPRSTIYEEMAKETFPKKVTIGGGGRSVAWVQAEVLDWIEAKIKTSRDGVAK